MVLASLSNVIQGYTWKGLQMTNALAYSTSLSLTKKKSFMKLTPGLSLGATRRPRRAKNIANTYLAPNKLSIKFNSLYWENALTDNFCCSDSSYLRA
jgi:hypothetical protein